MRILHDIPIKRKLTIIIMVTSCAALLLACLGYFTSESIDFRNSLVVELLTTADMTGYNSSSALSFNDPDSAAETLKSLATYSHILEAVLYDKSGKVFATYRGARMNGAFIPPPVEHDTHRFGRNRLELFRDIKLGGENIGSLYILHDMEEFWSDLRRYSFIGIIVMSAASVVAYLLSRRLREVITRPISHLSQVAGAVAAGRDYSVRASKECDDELGRLIDGFNAMLDQIQHRDSALQSARDDLEKRVEERTGELARSLSLLNATLDSTTDGILAVQFSGEVVCHNARFVAMWGIPLEVLNTRDVGKFRNFISTKAKAPEQYMQRSREIIAQREVDVFDVIELRDGRTFERYVSPHRIEGDNTGIVITYRDVSGRKRAEAELENINRQLLETSRTAGMAEVATSVLHNVGNVLNSVNVSCSVVSDKVRKSRIASVAKTADLLRVHADDLAGFFTNDPDGRMLPDFLGKLATRLAGEQAEVLKELQLLGQNIEHIKDIIAMQQNYAKNIGGVRETLPVEALVEDALRMNEGALHRHRIEVVREYGDVPPVSMEKHKVLQILVNLVRNAKHALTDGGRADKRLLVRIAHKDDHIIVGVSDNGIGIAPENLVRIFAHGFTTRKDGHGFGLHSGVLAAQEMGGTLTVHSGGPGTGATFTLEIPIDRDQRSNPPSKL